MFKSATKTISLSERLSAYDGLDNGCGLHLAAERVEEWRGLVHGRPLPEQLEDVRDLALLAAALSDATSNSYTK